MFLTDTPPICKDRGIKKIVLPTCIYNIIVDFVEFMCVQLYDLT